jgi:galactose mutarotase-like enzyme
MRASQRKHPARPGISAGMTDLLQPSPLQVAPPAGPPAAPDLVTISRPGGPAAAINLTGAELWWLRDAQGRDLLWDGDPAVWSGRCPILFPIVGRLAADTYRLNGEAHHMAKHGFARQARFTLAETGEDHVLLRLEDDAATRVSYPFAFALSLRFAITANGLTIAAEVANRGEANMPVSFGFHPALRWPLTSDQPREAHRILFDADEAPVVHRMDASGLLASTEPSPIVDRVLALRDDLFTQDALIFPEVNSRSFTYGAPDGPSVRVEAENLPDLGIWTKPGADFVCIEPWQGYNDLADFSGNIFLKPGIVTIAPGDVWKAGIALRITDGARN